MQDAGGSRTMVMKAEIELAAETRPEAGIALLGHWRTIGLARSLDVVSACTPVPLASELKLG